MLRDVVTTALGIPQEIAFQSIQAQEKAVGNRVNLTNFKDKQYVSTLVDQYLLNKQSAAQASSSAPTLDQLVAKSQGLVV